MTTVRQLIFGALQDLRVIALGDEPTDDEGDYCLDQYNQMMHGFELDGLALAHIDQVMGDTIDVPDHHIQALRLSLAERIADVFGASMTVEQRMRAEQGRMGLRAYHFTLYDLGSEHPLSSNNLATDE